jgi:hypothetical protein
VADVTANARVVTARNGPRMRRAGSPMMRATTAATTTPATSARKKSQLWRAYRTEVVAPPKPTNANWPSEMWPAQPVRISSETATMQ